MTALLVSVRVLATGCLVLSAWLASGWVWSLVGAVAVSVALGDL